VSKYKERVSLERVAESTENGYGIPIPIPDPGIADQLASTADEQDSTRLLQQFIDEIRYFIPPANSSGPKGRSLQGEYYMERLDPLHQFGHPQEHGRLRNACFLVCLFIAGRRERATAALFMEWLGQQKSPNVQDVFALIDYWKKNPGDLTGKDYFVNYLDTLKRQKYVIEPRGSLLYCRASADGWLATECVEFDTSQSLAAFDNRQDMAIWVQGPSGRFYSSTNSKAGKFHHSSFLAGREVKAAGDWNVTKGELKMISAISGHYKPPLEALQGALRDLAGVSSSLIAAADVEVYDKKSNKQSMIKAEKFCEWKRSELDNYKAVNQ